MLKFLCLNFGDYSKIKVHEDTVSSPKTSGKLKRMKPTRFISIYTYFFNIIKSYFYVYLPFRFLFFSFFFGGGGGGGVHVHEY